MSIIAVIILLTLLTPFLWPWPTNFLITNFMGYFFLIFGLFKIYNLRAFAQAYAEYDIIAKRSRVYALSYPFIEFCLGIAYLLNFAPTTTNMVTVLIMSIGSIGVAQTLIKHKQITCACLGVVFKIPMTYVSLLEDIIMALMALSMLLTQHII